MGLQIACDGCTVTADTDAEWLQLSRRTTDAFAFAFGRGDGREPDPVLGRRGLVFHSYDCLRLWLITKGDVA